MSKTCSTCQRVFNTEKEFLTGTSRWRLCNQGHLWFECSCKSTLMIIKGKFDWYSPEKFMSPEASSVFNRLSGLQDLPYIPNEILSLQELIQDESTETSKLAEEVKKEPFVAKEVLSMAENIRNSRNPGQKPLQVLEHAISYIGRQALRDVLITASLKTFEFKTKVFDPEDFWREAYTTGAIAERIAKTLAKDAIPDEVHLAGIMANMGKIVAAICLPEEADSIHQFVKNRETMTAWQKAEAELEYVSHTALGEIGAAIWGFPTYVKDAASLHHNAELDDNNHVMEYSVEFYQTITLANQLSHWVLLQPHRIDNRLMKRLRKFFNLSEKDVEALAEDCLDLRAT